MAKTLRFRFSRGEGLKYIAHLDMLRLFERAIKRAQLPVSYTQGFNPRQKIVFGLPMSIGLTSDSEFADIELDEDLSPETFVDIMNKHLPDGIRVDDAVEHTSKDNIMNQITAARYEITFETDRPMSRFEIDSLVHDFLGKEEIIVSKKTKKGMRPVNIRPMIYSLSAKKKDTSVFVLEAFLSAGAENNLRADLLLEAFSQESGINSRAVCIHRKALYASTYNEWKNPFEVSHD
jgi:radical SAM-linked protein